MDLKKLLTAALALLCFSHSPAQVFPQKNYPQNYFRWPVEAKIALAANFGELRPNHYHMGLDCKTDQKENHRVFAAADGYVAKIKIEPFGFGRCIYINHPNGLTTLYAHLNDFYPELEKYVSGEQYKSERWRIFLEDIPPGLLPVKKGQFIAFSGNTGGSQGPHLHFEIRDTKTDKVLNPLLFGFPIVDHTPPDVLRLAVYDRCTSTYEQTPKFYSLRKKNGIYSTSPTLIIAHTDKVSFGITAFDRYANSTSQNGIFEAILYENEKPVVGFQLDSISYDETRYLNAHIDYRLKALGGPYVQHVSKLPGYPEGVYKVVSGDGVINIEDDSIHHMKIEVNDANGNTSIVQFEVQRGQTNVPKVVDTMSFYQSKEFHPGFVNIFENNDVSFYLPENALYDSMRFRYNVLQSKINIPGAVSPVYQLQGGIVPVQDSFPIKIRSDIDPVWKDKIVMERFWNTKNNFEKAEYENGWYRSRFRDFGYFHLLLDTTGPTITPVGFREGFKASKLKKIAFVIKDESEDLVNFRAEIDGKWLCFSNDKGKTFVYKFDEHCPPGEHELKISVEDCVGNKTEKIYHFTR